jgi:hypothetical protein
MAFGNALTFDNKLDNVLNTVNVPASITVSSASHTIAAPVVVLTDLNVTTTTANSNLAITGSLTSGYNVGNNIVKLGLGTLEINGVASHSGNTTVNGGTLRGTGSITTSPVTVNTGGTLGAGTSATKGILTLGAGLTLTTGSTLSIRMSTNVPGTGFDQIVVTGGNVDLGNATFAGSITGTSLVPADKLFVVNNTGAGTTTNGFNGVLQDQTITIGSYTAQISYVGDVAGGTLTGGNDVVLYNFVSTPVPEPTTILGLSALGLATFSGLRRRLRNRKSAV